MARLTRILRSADPVSETEANEVFELLIPVVEREPSADAAVEAASSVISRCKLSDDRPLAHVLDWWFVVTTGRATATGGGAHRLPVSLEWSIRVQMEAAVRLESDLPAAKWLQMSADLAPMVAGLDGRLKLEHYGAVKLPGERPAWSWLIDQLDPTVGALKASRRAGRVEIDRHHFEMQLRERGIEAGSRRYKEMVKRCLDATDHVNDIVRLQHEVEPWIPRKVLQPVSGVPSAFKHAVGPLAEALLRPILAANAAPSVNTDTVAAGLDTAGQSGDQRGRYKLARVVDAWCQQTGQSIRSLDAEMQRHRRLLAGMAELQARPTVADDKIEEIEIHVLDDDLPAAEAVLESLREQVSRDERAKLVRSQFEGLRRKFGESSLSDDAQWLDRVAAIEARLDTEDPHEMAREIGVAQTDLSRQLDEMIHEQQEDLRHLAAPLRELGAGDTEVREWARRIEQLERRGGRGANELKQDIESALMRRRDECRASVEKCLAEVDKVLTGERADFSDEVIGSFANRHAEIQSLIRNGELSDIELTDIRESATELLDELEDHRIRRWTADEGEQVLLDHLLHYCKGALDFHSQDIRRLYVSLKTRPFAVLAGLTGSGKSTLTRMFAEAVGATSRNGRFRRIAVRPDWIDQTEVLGFVNPISGVFVPGWLAETVRSCERDQDRLHFVLLDEMNLAPVEQYLAEWLSAIEERRSGSDDVRLPLYSPALKPDNADEWPPHLGLPDNLIIIGTVNVDETTRPLSERVLDRANLLLLSVEVSNRHHEPDRDPPRPWHVGVSEWREVSSIVPSDKHHDFLVDIADILRQASIGVGLRAHLELERFIANAEGILSDQNELDWGIVQRIIPKIRGFKGHLADCLGELLEEFDNVGAVQSASIVRRWLHESVSDDEFLDGTDPRLALARI